MVIFRGFRGTPKMVIFRDFRDHRGGGGWGIRLGGEGPNHTLMCNHLTQTLFAVGLLFLSEKQRTKKITSQNRTENKKDMMILSCGRTFFVFITFILYIIIFSPSLHHDHLETDREGDL